MEGLILELIFSLVLALCLERITGGYFLVHNDMRIHRGMHLSLICFEAFLTSFSHLMYIKQICGGINRINSCCFHDSFGHELPDNGMCLLAFFQPLS